MTAGWQAYIDAVGKRAERSAIEASMGAVAEVLVELQKKLRAEFETKLEAEVLKLRNEFLQDRLDQERGASRVEDLPPVPPPPPSICTGFSSSATCLPLARPSSPHGFES